MKKYNDADKCVWDINRAIAFVCDINCQFISSEHDIELADDLKTDAIEALSKLEPIAYRNKREEYSSTLITFSEILEGMNG